MLGLKDQAKFINVGKYSGLTYQYVYVCNSTTVLSICEIDGFVFSYTFYTLNSPIDIDAITNIAAFNEFCKRNQSHIKGGSFQTKYNPKCAEQIAALKNEIKMK